MLVAMNKYRPFQRFMIGLTLTEMLVCLSIMVILITLALPGFSQMIETQKLKTTVTEFYATINLTRSEAIKRGSQVSMVSNDGKSWKSGWRVVIRPSGNSAVGADGNGEEIIFSHAALTGDLLISHNFTDGSQPYISYTGNGRSRSNTSSEQPLAGTVTFMLREKTKRIKVNFLGRARICELNSDPTCGDNQSGG